MCDGNVLKFHLKWNRIVLQSHFHGSCVPGDIHKDLRLAAHMEILSVRR